MFFDDKKKAVTMIVSKRTPKGEVTMAASPMKPEIVKEADGEPDGKHLAAQDLLAAFHEKSPMKLSEALTNFLDIHHLASSKEE